MAKTRAPKCHSQFSFLVSCHFGLEFQGHFTGGLKLVFNGRDLLLEAFLCLRVTHARGDLARVLRGEIEHQDGVVDFPLRLQLQTSDAGNQWGNIGAGARSGALRS
jgi:hypothetical protein